MRATVVLQDPEIRIPGSVVDLNSFHRWIESADLPDEARVCYLQGEIWIDTSDQDVFSHVCLKGEFTRVLANLERSEDRGYYLPDGLRVSHSGVEISVRPDGTLALYESIARKAIRFVPGKTGDFIRMEGVPDMLLEIVSNSSVTKDTVCLKNLYWQAGVPEYWLVDARAEPLSFGIFCRGVKGYRRTRKVDGWLKSDALGKRVRLTQTTDPAGNPDYRLEVR
jgi:Uma2 family endonuclease